MAESARRRAYVSETYDDLREHRRLVGQVLRDFGYDDVSLEYFDARLGELAACDLYVAIIAWRYGYVPGENNPAGLSVTELEYERAMELGKPRLIFVVEQTAWPVLIDKDRRKITAFLDRVRRTDVVQSVSSLSALADALRKALVSLDTTPPLPTDLPPSPQTVALIHSLADSPERIARLLASIVLADHSRLALLESPNTAGIADALSSHNAQSADGVVALIGRMDDERFEPDPLWLAWITHIHRERLTEIGSEILRVSGLGGME